MKTNKIKLSRVFALVAMVAVLAFGIYYCNYHLTVTKNIPTVIFGIVATAGCIYAIYAFAINFNLKKQIKFIKDAMYE